MASIGTRGLRAGGTASGRAGATAESVAIDLGRNATRENASLTIGESAEAAEILAYDVELERVELGQVFAIEDRGDILHAHGRPHMQADKDVAGLDCLVDKTLEAGRTGDNLDATVVPDRFDAFKIVSADWFELQAQGLPRLVGQLLVFERRESCGCLGRRSAALVVIWPGVRRRPRGQSCRAEFL